jgi:hypothetical protein
MEHGDVAQHNPGYFLIFGEKCGLFGEKSCKTSYIQPHKGLEKNLVFLRKILYDLEKNPVVFQVCFHGLLGGSMPPISDNYNF